MFEGVSLNPVHLYWWAVELYRVADYLSIESLCAFCIQELKGLNAEIVRELEVDCIVYLHRLSLSGESCPQNAIEEIFQLIEEKLNSVSCPKAYEVAWTLPMPIRQIAGLSPLQSRFGILWPFIHFVKHAQAVLTRPGKMEVGYYFRRKYKKVMEHHLVLAREEKAALQGGQG